MKLTPDERAFIARWLLEFGEEPVSRDQRVAAKDWFASTGYSQHANLWVVTHLEPGFGWIHPEALTAFKGDDYE